MRRGGFLVRPDPAGRAVVRSIRWWRMAAFSAGAGQFFGFNSTSPANLSESLLFEGSVRFLVDEPERAGVSESRSLASI